MSGADTKERAPGLGTAIATLFVLVLAMAGVPFPDGGEAVMTGSLTVIIGFALHRYGVISPHDRDGDGVIDEDDVGRLGDQDDETVEPTPVRPARQVRRVRREG